MANEDLLRQVHPEVYSFRTSVVLELAADWQEPGVVASDDLILDESLLEGVGFFEGTVVFFEDL